MVIKLLDPIIPLQFQVDLDLSRCEGIMNIASQQACHKTNFQLTYKWIEAFKSNENIRSN